ncbi:sporulation protein [Peribacillus asahii]|uniref:Sporulation protein n=1 Tax=Peribacillus asahii TaxID=228899 RepID=A0A3T0KXV0_9BACI|nr:sporulation protein [Peribacillus asahii]AZV45149.1 sporulation protein [Peribacillus asahii]USK84757.1 sporulation protein [Peribacillus asahii]
MILRKSMALLGIGSARIDLILQKEAHRPGEVVYGYFSINGGSIEQKLKRIDCNLVLTDKAAGIEKVIDTKIILTSKLVNSEELYTLPFTFRIPASIGASTDEISYRFQTKLHFNEGVTSQDQDIIQIL